MHDGLNLLGRGLCGGRLWINLRDHFELRGGEKSLQSAGLHRAKRAEVYAWADSRANKGGTVYVLSQ